MSAQNFKIHFGLKQFSVILIALRGYANVHKKIFDTSYCLPDELQVLEKAIKDCFYVCIYVSV